MLLFLLAVLPLLSAELVSVPDTSGLCKGKEFTPFSEGNFFKRCKLTEFGTRIEIVGCRSISNEMLVIGKEKTADNGLIEEKCSKVGDQVVYGVGPAGKSVDGIFYNCREHYGPPLPIGCTPVMSLEKTYNSFLPFGREISIAGIKQRCEIFPNRTALITLKNPHEDQIDFNRQVQTPKILPEACYFNGREMKRGTAVRIGKVTIACVKNGDKSELRFVGCYDEPLHFDTEKYSKYPEWLMVANCEKPGLVTPNEKSDFEFYTL
ncbi:hypothetical protein PRIPAC_75072 [Pristionchus pacificus]|uniref:Uncharacterized protein n=1 Tax=Pristionchus pacificus TaxID=54126 RepID=A0A2A6C735_PRIPA|nr:hypothetical protein PRIPAC_75072 [Pristionchus pacificus]|eukprot:PDM73873.1 hypothetical protein PRIPAC_41229 [Pristionchus pacificus]